MTKKPAFQFYSGDWLKEPKLAMCAPESRGIWIDLLCAMHELDRCGQITGSADQMARIGRCTTVQLVQALDELQSTHTADITQRNGIYTVANRRMRREYLERAGAKCRKQKQRMSQNVTDSHNKVTKLLTDEKNDKFEHVTEKSRLHSSSSSSKILITPLRSVISDEGTSKNSDITVPKLLSHFGKRYKKYTGVEYHASFSKDGKLLKDLIGHYGGDKVKAGIDYFFDHYVHVDDFAAKKPTVGVFNSLWNSMVAESKGKRAKTKSEQRLMETINNLESWYGEG